jgi:hypothetical protein
MPEHKWEYKIHFEFTAESLNELGRGGWEAVGITQRMTGASEMNDKLRAGAVAVLFKREAANPSGGSTVRVREL